MLSPLHTQDPDSFVVTSNLDRLLRERGLNNRKLARLTGLTERAISESKRRKVVGRIDCRAAVRICMTLSSTARLRGGKTVPIRLDALFPIVKA